MDQDKQDQRHVGRESKWHMHLEKEFPDSMELSKVV